MSKKDTITVQGTEITVISERNNDYISLTDMTLSFKEGSGLIGKWITNKNTLEYLGVWEKVNNPDFNYPEFGVIGQEAGTNRFIMSAGQWIERTKALGMLVKAGRYGGTYAHKDIAFHFAMWLSPEFQIYLINEFQRLKDDENNRLKLEWNLQRTLSKINYRIHTDAISLNYDYYEFLDYPDFWSNSTHGNHENLINHSLDNMESINALLIRQGLSQGERLVQLNSVAITQMRSLLSNRELKR